MQGERMTWSILARDARGHFGMAIASRFFAVGSLCVHARRGVGALSTQALMNPLYGPAALDCLAQGATAAQAIAQVIADDAGREHRQIHVMPLNGPAAAHTGAQCIDWCGHIAREDVSVAGNMLAGPGVLDATVQAYLAAEGRPMAERLLAAMDAGQAAGGDKRGKQAASLKILADEDYWQLDLRVDDHPEPLAELRKLYTVSLERFQPFLSCLPGRGRPTGMTDRAQIESVIAQFHAQSAKGP